MKRILLFAASVCLALHIMAQNTDRAKLLENSHNAIVTTKNGQQHYYLVNSQRSYVVHRAEGKIVIDSDTFNTADISSIRFHNIPRFAIDEDSTTLGSNYAVTSGLLAFRRSMNVDRWNTIVLPFSLNAAQVRDAFGEETLVASVIRITEGETTTVEFATVNTDDDQSIVLEEGQPYLIRPTRQPDIAEGSNTAVDYGSGRVSGPVYVIPNVSIEKGKKSFTPIALNSDSRNSTIRIRGTYTATTASSSRYPVYLLNDEGRFEQMEDATPVKGFRTWMEIIKNADQRPLRFYIDGIEEDLTLPSAISSVTADNTTTSADVYDLLGRKTSGQPRQGIYIVGGRKVVIR